MIYLIHFSSPLHHARHYLGFTRNARTLPRRVEHHRNGTGAKLMAAVADAGIEFEVVRTWRDGTRDDERRLKNGKNSPRLCPVCRQSVRRAA